MVVVRSLSPWILRQDLADGRGTSAAGATAAVDDDFDQVMARRKAEADEFYGGSGELGGSSLVPLACDAGTLMTVMPGTSR